MDLALHTLVALEFDEADAEKCVFNFCFRDTPHCGGEEVGEAGKEGRK